MTEARVGGYEWGIRCPNCGYRTDATRSDSSNEYVCGEDFKTSDNHGCGATLKVTVENVSDNDD